MTRTLEPVTGAGRILFELDRFELINDDQYELQGRWFGVRGRRFMRPALTVTVDDHPVRLLADLADKPWAAEDGRPWKAAFPSRFEVGDVQEAELSVAPDITIGLRAPRPGTANRTKPKPSGAHESQAPEQVPEATKQDALKRELFEARRHEDHLQRQLDRVKTERAKTSARMDELLGNLSGALQEREEAQAARDQALGRLEELGRRQADLEAQRQTAVRELDRVRQERAVALAERDSARRERDDARAMGQTAARTRDEALAERDAALRARARAEAERDASIEATARGEAECQVARGLQAQALAERDEALAARDDAVRERESIRGVTHALKAEVAHEVSARGAAMVMRQAVAEPPAFRTHSPLLPRALAIIVLMAAVVVLLIVFHVA
jgi:hypothetical protein